MKALERHTDEDDRRFDRVDDKLTSITTKLYVLIGLVCASGATTFLAHGG